MVKCSAAGCTTTENTQIDGRSPTLFSFPTYDDSLVKQWKENSKNHFPDDDLAQLKLCELHFQPDCFASTEKTALAPGAVPTIFEMNTKRSLSDNVKADISEAPPAKQIQLQEAKPPILEPSPRESLAVEASPEAVADAVDNRAENLHTIVFGQVENGLGPVVGSSLFTKQIDMGKKVYRLIIRIDRVIEPGDARSGPKAVEKPARTQRPLKSRMTSGTMLKNGGIARPCTKTGCKLIKTTLNSKPVFLCERCSKYYVVKESKSDVSAWTCSLCQKILSSPDSLGVHMRTHYTCDMCQEQCSTQLMFDKHVRLHVSTDPLLPYKCHRCTNTFEVKTDVRQHYVDKHSRATTQQDNPSGPNRPGQVLFRCEYCYAVFKKEQAYKSHVNLHVKGNSGFDCALCNKSFNTAKHHADHQARHLSTVKFTCRVCGKEFSSSEGVEAHMKTHMKIQRLDLQPQKCTVCGKVFKNEISLGSHMQGHLTRAHRCPLCHKAFINKATLSIHFKTHGKASLSPSNSRESVDEKRHSCTLCLSTFDSRSKLYNHIMTHLEKMHAGEGDMVFDGLDELLGNKEDIIS